MPSKPAALTVRKLLTFTPGQWARVRAWRFKMHVDTEAEAVRRLIDRGLSTWTPPVPSVTAKDAEPPKIRTAITPPDEGQE